MDISTLSTFLNEEIDYVIIDIVSLSNEHWREYCKKELEEVNQTVGENL